MDKTIENRCREHGQDFQALIVAGIYATQRGCCDLNCYQLAGHFTGLAAASYCVRAARHTACFLSDVTTGNPAYLGSSRAMDAASFAKHCFERNGHEFNRGLCCAVFASCLFNRPGGERLFPKAQSFDDVGDWYVSAVLRSFKTGASRHAPGSWRDESLDDNLTRATRHALSARLADLACERESAAEHIDNAVARLSIALWLLHNKQTCEGEIHAIKG